MLIRFFIDNFYSFGKSKEFNMLPRPRYKLLDHHKYHYKEFDLLKLSAIYGANGSGKSNLVKSLIILKDLVEDEELPIRFGNTSFKFGKLNKKQSQTLGIEFLQEGEAFYYALEFLDGIIKTEELYKSGLGSTEDQLIFERKSNKRKTTITFLKDFEEDTESKVLKGVIEKNFTKPNKPLLKFLSTLDNKFLIDTKTALNWFTNTLKIIKPESRPGLAYQLDADKKFKNFAQDLMCKFDIGITKLISESKTIKELLGDDNYESSLQKIQNNFDTSESNILALRSNDGDEIILVKEEDNIYAKLLKLEHSTEEGKTAQFDLSEESDGTIRLLDFIPAIRDIITKEKVYIIDEIERSIHPLLIKELVKKFSFDEKTKGQLVFTTHESNLLDQSIFRQDEIWFAEKDKTGSTDIYSLSDFKEHNTIDIKKGYLNGRYGSIPFLGNLKELNWHTYDTQKTSVSKN